MGGGAPSNLRLVGLRFRSLHAPLITEGLHGHGVGSGLGKQLRAVDGWGMVLEFCAGNYRHKKPSGPICMKNHKHPKGRLHRAPMHFPSKLILAATV